MPSFSCPSFSDSFSNDCGQVIPVPAVPPGAGKRRRRGLQLQRYKRVALQVLYKRRNEELDPSRRLQRAVRAVAEDIAKPFVPVFAQDELVTLLLPFVKVMEDLRKVPDKEITEFVDWKAAAADAHTVTSLLELHETVEYQMEDPDDEDEWLLLGAQ